MAEKFETEAGATGIGPDGREITFISGPLHCNGLSSEEALSVAGVFEDEASHIKGKASGQMKKRAEELVAHAIREEEKEEKEKNEKEI